jgi:hypothetical protein
MGTSPSDIVTSARSLVYSMISCSSKMMMMLFDVDVNKTQAKSVHQREEASAVTMVMGR